MYLIKFPFNYSLLILLKRNHEIENIGQQTEIMKSVNH